MRLCGSRSPGIRLIEASTLNFGQDFDWQHNPVEVGLGWMISETKVPWSAYDTLLAAKKQKPACSVIGLRFFGYEIPLIGDVVRHGEQVLGHVTSAMGSPTLGYPIAMALIMDNPELGAKVSVEAGDNLLEAEIVTMPFFDPERKLSKVK